MGAMHRAAAALGATLAVMLGACTSSDSPDAAPDSSSTVPTAPTTTTAPGLTAFVLGGGQVQAPDPAVTTLPPEVVAGVQAALDRYLTDAVLAPLGSGQPAGDLTPLFTPNALSRMGGTDRATLVDEDLPPAEAVRVRAASAELSGLAGGDGQVAVVVARIDLQVASEVQGSPVTIHRFGELALVPDGGAWKIDTYDLTVARDTATATQSPGGTRP